MDLTHWFVLVGSPVDPCKQGSTRSSFLQCCVLKLQLEMNITQCKKVETL